MARKTERVPQTIDEARQFLEKLLRREESFHLSLELSVSLYGTRVNRGESFSLMWFTTHGRENFRSHSLELLLREFLAWKLRPVALPPTPKPALNMRPAKRLEVKPAIIVDSLWGKDPEL